MAFSYGKLSQPHQLDDHDKQLKAIVRKGRVTSFVILTVFAVVFIAVVMILVPTFLGKETKMLTEPQSFAGGTMLGFLFWVAAALGCWVGFRYPKKWWKRLLSVPVSVLLIHAFFMLAVGKYNEFQEYRLFNKGQSTKQLEQFRVSNVRYSRRGKGRARVKSPKYPDEGFISTDRDAYILLRNNLVKLPKTNQRTVYDTGYCVQFVVEHNGNDARILVDGKITLDQLIKCPLPSSAMIRTAGTNT